MNAYPLVRGSQLRPGFTRLVLTTANATRVRLTDGSCIETWKIPQEGRRVHFPRAENQHSAEAWIWIGSQSPTSSSPLVRLRRGGTYAAPWTSGSLTIGRPSIAAPEVAALGSNHPPMVVLLAEDDQSEISDGMEPAQNRTVADYFFYSGLADSVPFDYNAFQLSSTRPPSGYGGDEWTTPPHAINGNSPEENYLVGWLLDNVSRLTFAVLDASATSCAGLVLRLWWYLPNLVPQNGASLKCADASGVGVGWVPEPTTFTVTDYGRIFSVENGVRSGVPQFRNPYWGDSNQGILDAGNGATNNYLTENRHLGGGHYDSPTNRLIRTRFTFQVVGSIPADSDPYLIVLGEER